MKKCLFVLIIALVSISCNNDHSNKNQATVQKKNLDKEEELNLLYKDSVVPLFTNYEDINIPKDLVIDKEDLAINAGAVFNYVEVSSGLVNTNDVSIQIFVLAHEVAHIATISQANKFGLFGAIPSGDETNEYKKAEYLADLIAMHLIKKQLPMQFKQLRLNSEKLKNLLDSSETFTHPSGTERMTSLEVYFQNCTIQKDHVSFHNRFHAIWMLN